MEPLGQDMVVSVFVVNLVLEEALWFESRLWSEDRRWHCHYFKEIPHSVKLKGFYLDPKSTGSNGPKHTRRTQSQLSCILLGAR